jgi:hypothetical protein
MNRPARAISTIAALLMLLTGANATVPLRDEMRYEGKDTVVWEYPLGPLLRSRPDILPFDEISTANRAGWEAKWEIRDGKLLLISFQARRKGKPVLLSELFPGKKLPVFADWYTGTLNTPTGAYVHNSPPLDPMFERLTILRIEKGIVVSTIERKNARVERDGR